MGKSTISMAIFHSYFDITEGTDQCEIYRDERVWFHQENWIFHHSEGMANLDHHRVEDMPVQIPSGYVKIAMENGHL